MRRLTPLRPRYSWAMPNPSVASLFQSERSGKVRSSTCIHAMCVYGESRDIA